MLHHHQYFFLSFIEIGIGDNYLSIVCTESDSTTYHLCVTRVVIQKGSQRIYKQNKIRHIIRNVIFSGFYNSSAFKN